MNDFPGVVIIIIDYNGRLHPLRSYVNNKKKSCCRVQFTKQGSHRNDIIRIYHILYYIYRNDIIYVYLHCMILALVVMIYSSPKNMYI